jgi:hypothetical protein
MFDLSSGRTVGWLAPEIDHDVTVRYGRIDGGRMAQGQGAGASR